MDYLVIGEIGEAKGEVIRGMRNTRAMPESFVLIDSDELARLKGEPGVVVREIGTKAKIRRNGRAEWLPLIAVRNIDRPAVTESVVINIEVDLREGRPDPGEIRRVIVGLIKVIFRDARITRIKGGKHE